MLEWLFSWEVTSVVVVAAATIALAVLALNDFALAKVFFLMAAADACGGVLMWGMRSRLGTWQVATMVFILVGGIGAIAVLALRYVESKKHVKEAKSPTSDTKSNPIEPVNTSADEFAELVAKKLKSFNAESSLPLVSTPSRRDTNDGFVQYESMQVLADSPETLNDFSTGRQFRINFTIANRGQRPVYDNQSWGIIAFVDPALNTGIKLRPIVLEGAKTGYKKFKGQGGMLGVGLTQWNTAVSFPLKQEEAEQLKQGEIRIFLLLSGAWTDEKGAAHYWTQCMWTNWGEVSFDRAIWHVI
jgi:hypothetical protein